MADIERMELLAQVAEMYYIEALNQSDIAEKFDFSRSKVSRLLTEARENGLVEVTIHHPLDRSIDLEKLLISKYQLNSVLILKSGNQTQEQMLRSLGRLGAFYLSDILTAGCTLGISWGTAVYEVAHAFKTKYIADFKVVQVIGSIGYGDPSIDGPEVARRIALTFSGKYYTLNAPVIVQDKNTRNRLLKERNIREVLNRASKARAIVVGIGSSDPGRSGIVRAGYLEEDDMAAINETTGAVGDICCWLFDQDGEYKDIEFNRRVVGISLDTLKKSKAEVIGVAGGREKASVILGALRGRLIDTLITDDKAAEDLLKLDQD
jgi:DNA-binding transcriptional regulator LsrR (DeoR family)